MKLNNPWPTIVVGILSIIGFGIAISAYEALLVMLGWNWFVAPAFGIGPIGFWHAFGISTLVYAILASIKTTNNKDNQADSPIEAFVMVFGQFVGSVVGLSICLGIMAIAHLLMGV